MKWWLIKFVLRESQDILPFTSHTLGEHCFNTHIMPQLHQSQFPNNAYLLTAALIYRQILPIYSITVSHISEPVPWVTHLAKHSNHVLQLLYSVLLWCPTPLPSQNINHKSHSAPPYVTTPSFHLHPVNFFGLEFPLKSKEWLAEAFEEDNQYMREPETTGMIQFL